MDLITKHFKFLGNKAYPTLDLFLQESGWIKNDDIIKSSASQVSEYKIYVRSYTNLSKYKLRNFSLNEMEADFDIDDGELKRIEFRDTSVHKKIVFTSQSAVITVVRGSDAVGAKTDTLQTTLKEPIIGISVNDKELNAPFDLNTVYKEFTGLDVKYLTEEEIEEEKVNANMWAELAEQLKEEGL